MRRLTPEAAATSQSPGSRDWKVPRTRRQEGPRSNAFNGTASSTSMIGMSWRSGKETFCQLGSGRRRLLFYQLPAAIPELTSIDFLAEFRDERRVRQLNGLVRLRTAHDLEQFGIDHSQTFMDRATAS